MNVGKMKYCIMYTSKLEKLFMLCKCLNFCGAAQEVITFFMSKTLNKVFWPKLYIAYLNIGMLTLGLSNIRHLI